MLKNEVPFSFEFKLLRVQPCWLALSERRAEKRSSWRIWYFGHTCRPCSWHNGSTHSHFGDFQTLILTNRMRKTAVCLSSLLLDPIARANEASLVQFHFNIRCVTFGCRCEQEGWSLVVVQNSGAVWTWRWAWSLIPYPLLPLSLKPVLNWANICLLNILQTVRRTMIHFLIELLVRRTWFGQFDELYFVLNWLVMRCKLRPKLAADAQQTAWSKM